MNIAICELAIAVCLHTFIVYQIMIHKDELQKRMPIYLRWNVAVVLSFFLMCFLFPGKADPKYFFTQQMVVSFTHFLEAFSLISQLYHLHMSMALEGLNSGYLIVLGLARVNRIIFWYHMSAKLGTFWYLIAADVMNTFLVLGYFILYRFVSKRAKSTSVLGMSTKDEIYRRWKHFTL